MEKILKIETLILSGKFVDEEQKVTYTTKSSVEKSLADLKGIQTALEEVAKEEQDRAGGGQSSSAHAGSSEETKDSDAAASPVEFPLSEKRVAVAESDTSEVVEKLLKTFQVIHRYEAATSKPLPVDVASLSQAISGSVSGAQVAFQGLLEVRIRTNRIFVLRKLRCVFVCRVCRKGPTFGSCARIPSPSCCRKCARSGSVAPARITTKYCFTKTHSPSTGGLFT